MSSGSTAAIVVHAPTAEEKKHVDDFVAEPKTAHEIEVDKTRDAYSYELALDSPRRNASSLRKPSRLAYFDHQREEEEQHKHADYERLRGQITKLHDAQIEIFAEAIPMQKSRFMQQLYYHCKEAFSERGHPMRITLFSGGVVYCNLETLKVALKHLAIDLDRNVVTTINEIALNTDGVRIFFEFDCRGKSLPTPADWEYFSAAAQTLVKECYPSTVDVTAYIALCSPKLKWTTSGNTTIACGMHIVFPNIVTTTGILKQLTIELNVRISRWNGRYTDIVDDVPVHAASANLRLLFSHKMLRCKNCKYANLSTSSDASTNKRKIDEDFVAPHNTICNKKLRTLYGTAVPNIKVAKKVSLSGFSNANIGQLDVLPDTGMQHEADDYDFFGRNESLQMGSSSKSGCGECYFGKVVSPYVYEPGYLLDRRGQVDAESLQTMSTHELLTHYAINPVYAHQHAQCYSVGFHEGLNFTYDVLDGISSRTGDISFKMERSKISAITGRAISISGGQDPELCSFMADLLRLHFPSRHYERSYVVKVHVQANTIFVNFGGPGSRFCRVKNDVHHSNRVYMQLNKDRTVQIGCYNKQCKKTITAVFAHKRSERGAKRQKSSAQKIIANASKKDVLHIAVTPAQIKTVWCDMRDELSADQVEFISRHTQFVFSARLTYKERIAKQKLQNTKAENKQVEVISQRQRVVDNIREDRRTAEESAHVEFMAQMALIQAV
jgi:hypothetical protein